VTFAGWAATIGLIIILFAIDLLLLRPGHAHAVGFGEAVTPIDFLSGRRFATPANRNAVRRLPVSRSPARAVH
jgi:hypothetical protein